MISTRVPTVLIEHGFYTNQKELELLKSDAFRQKCAEADTAGILAYLGVHQEMVRYEDMQTLRSIGLADTTINWLAGYQYGRELISKLAEER